MVLFPPTNRTSYGSWSYVANSSRNLRNQKQTFAASGSENNGASIRQHFAMVGTPKLCILLATYNPEKMAVF